jgi:nitrite reductase (NADH) small subunit
MVLEKVGRKSELQQLIPMIIEKHGMSIGLYKADDSVYAYLNRCSHQGGPVCEGSTVPLREYKTAERLSVLTREYTDQFLIVCPWHGLRYKLETGVCATNKNMRLMPMKVVTEGDDIMLDFPNS